MNSIRIDALISRCKVQSESTSHIPVRTSISNGRFVYKMIAAFGSAHVFHQLLFNKQPPTFPPQRRDAASLVSTRASIQCTCRRQSRNNSARALQASWSTFLMALEWKHDPKIGCTEFSIFFATVTTFREIRNHINKKGRVTAFH